MQQQQQGALPNAVVSTWRALERVLNGQPLAPSPPQGVFSAGAARPSGATTPSPVAMPLGQTAPGWGRPGHPTVGAVAAPGWSDVKQQGTTASPPPPPSSSSPSSSTTTSSSSNATSTPPNAAAPAVPPRETQPTAGPTAERAASGARASWHRAQFTGRPSVASLVISPPSSCPGGESPSNVVETTSALGAVEPQHMMRSARSIGRRKLSPGESWAGLPVVVGARFAESYDRPYRGFDDRCGGGGVGLGVAVAPPAWGCAVGPAGPQPVGVYCAPACLCVCGGDGIACCAKARERCAESELVRKMKTMTHVGHPELHCHSDHGHRRHRHHRRRRHSGDREKVAKEFIKHEVKKDVAELIGEDAECAVESVVHCHTGNLSRMQGIHIAHCTEENGCLDPCRRRRHSHRRRGRRCCRRHSDGACPATCRYRYANRKHCHRRRKSSCSSSDSSSSSDSDGCRSKWRRGKKRWCRSYRTRCKPKRHGSCGSDSSRSGCSSPSVSSCFSSSSSSSCDSDYCSPGCDRRHRHVYRRAHSSDSDCSGRRWSSTSCSVTSDTHSVCLSSPMSGHYRRRCRSSRSDDGRCGKRRACRRSNSCSDSSSSGRRCDSSSNGSFSDLSFSSLLGGSSSCGDGGSSFSSFSSSCTGRGSDCGTGRSSSCTDNGSFSGSGGSSSARGSSWDSFSSSDSDRHCGRKRGCHGKRRACSTSSDCGSSSGSSDGYENMRSKAARLIDHHHKHKGDSVKLGRLASKARRHF